MRISSVITPPAAARALSRPRTSGRSLRRQLRERAIAAAIGIVALTGIAAIVLIFVFIGKETLPILTDAATREEVSFAKMFLPQVVRAGRPASFVWQPVSRNRRRSGASSSPGRYRAF